MSQDPRLAIVALTERIGAVSAKADAAHDRIDNMGELVRHDMKEVILEMKEVVAWMNRSKGWAAAATLLAGIVGGAVVKVLTLLIGH